MLLVAMLLVMQTPLLIVAMGVRLATSLRALEGLHLPALLLAAKKVEHVAVNVMNAAVETAPAKAPKLATSVANWNIARMRRWVKIRSKG